MLSSYSLRCCLILWIGCYKYCRFPLHGHHSSSTNQSQCSQDAFAETIPMPDYYYSIISNTIGLYCYFLFKFLFHILATIISKCQIILNKKTSHVNGHGRLRDPPSRSSAWREGFKTPPDFNVREFLLARFGI